jgi:hypothetical protein
MNRTDLETLQRLVVDDPNQVLGALVTDLVVKPGLAMLDATGGVPLIYAGSPLRPQEGDPGWPDADKAMHANVRFAEETCRDIALSGAMPLAPHLILPRFMSDADEFERALALRLGKILVAISTEAWFVLPPWRREMSSGMVGESALAQKLGIPFRACYSATAFKVQIDRLRAGEVLPRVA